SFVFADDQADAVFQRALELAELDFGVALMFLPTPFDVGELEAHFLTSQKLMALAADRLAPNVFDHPKPRRSSKEPPHEVPEPLFARELQRAALRGRFAPVHFAGWNDRAI